MAKASNRDGMRSARTSTSRNGGKNPGRPAAKESAGQPRARATSRSKAEKEGTRPKAAKPKATKAKTTGEKPVVHRSVTGYECYHCKEWVPPGQPHDCWTTTEAALTGELSEDLRDAWERLREAAVELGPQRVYASGTAIMFSRKVCYAFVRPKRRWLDVTVFLGRALKGPQVVSARPASKTRVANIVRITHRDQVEAPLTDWLAEAYSLVPGPERDLDRR